MKPELSYSFYCGISVINNKVRVELISSAVNGPGFLNIVGVDGYYSGVVSHVVKTLRTSGNDSLEQK